MNVASTSNHCPVPKVGLDDSCGKATDAVINSGTGTVQSNASATKTIAQGDDLFGIAQALTSLSRKVSGTDASASSSASEATSHKQPAHATQGQALSASNPAVRPSSSSTISETDWNTTATTTTTTTSCGMSSSSLSSMSDQQQSNLAEGSNISENDPNDDQANGRFPDILRFMMDYATAEGCNKFPGQRAASWSDDGKSIVILDKVLFCEQVLPLFF